MSTDRKTAVVIKGNPSLLVGEDKRRADSFYRRVGRTLERRGYEVSFDAGLPMTVPSKADLWVGHSRGADRLRFAPRGTRTLALGSPYPGAINHPRDRNAKGGVAPGEYKAAGKYHYVLTRAMKEKLAFRAFTGELEKIAAFEKLSELEKEAILRKLRIAMGDAFAEAGKHVDMALAKRYLNKGKTDMAIWHSDKKPIKRIAKVMGRDPGVAPVVAGIEGVSQTILAPIPMFHTPSLAWATASRKLRGKQTPLEMYKRIKKHRKVGVDAP